MKNIAVQFYKCSALKFANLSGIRHENKIANQLNYESSLIYSVQDEGIGSGRNTQKLFQFFLSFCPFNKVGLRASEPKRGMVFKYVARVKGILVSK